MTDGSAGAVVRPALARAPVLGAAAAVAVALLATAGRYGYHRDELYFRALPPAWGYVDQPPLTPFLARTAAAVSDELWVLRIPAIACCALAVVVVARVARELGGGRGAQGLAAWGFVTGALPLSFGHVLLTASVDLVVWPLVVLLVVRALLRDPRWWLLAGAVAGLSTANKLLIGLLAAALAVGLLVAGPWRVLRSRWLWGGVALALLTALPVLVWQAANDWPQLAMGAALGERNGASVRVQVVPLLVVLLGPPLVPVWVAGVVALWRRPAWRPVRLLAPALVALVVLSVAAGAQVYYPLGLLSAVYAAGCVPVAEWLSRRGAWGSTAVPALAINGAASAVISLPLLPVGVVGATPIPGINQTVAESVGWPAYVEQVARVHAGTGDPDAAIVTSNYGEHGAIARFGPDLGLPQPFSGHNHLWEAGPPPDGTRTVVLVGRGVDAVADLFAACRVVAELDNGVDVDAEEQGAPVSVCTDPVAPWDEIWPAFRHLD